MVDNHFPYKDSHLGHPPFIKELNFVFGEPFVGFISELQAKRHLDT